MQQLSYYRPLLTTVRGDPAEGIPPAALSLAAKYDLSVDEALLTLEKFDFNVLLAEWHLEQNVGIKEDLDQLLTEHERLTEYLRLTEHERRERRRERLRVLQERDVERWRARQQRAAQGAWGGAQQQRVLPGGGTGERGPPTRPPSPIRP